MILLGSFKVSAQVKDISVTLSPALEYTLWDNKSGLEDGLLFGGKVGFGFGEYIELRATYMQDIDLNTSFSDFGLVNYSSDSFTKRDVNLTRIGGEFKANFGTSTKLNPYFTLGSGVQTIQLESQFKHEQIFASLGLGAKFNMGKRTVFAIEAKNTMYNFNAGSRLLTEADKLTFGVSDADFNDEKLSNWSAMASLQFYLGGRKPGTLTELDQAYLNSFSGGFSGVRFVLEPGLSNIQFDNESNFRDAWLLGGYLGLDFNDYIGIRAFYYQAANDEQISTDFDKLSMYGGEFRARLNQPTGVVPYIALGGGYMNASNGYLGKNGSSVNNSYFASGGLGLQVPLVKGVLAYGGIKALLTSNANEEDLQSPDQIQTHIMYDFGLKLVLGKKAASPSTVYNENLEEVLNEQQLDNDIKISNLKAGYQEKITQLEADLKKAKANKDLNKAVEILEDKKATVEALKEVEAVEVVAATKKTENIKKATTEKKVEVEKIVVADDSIVDENKPAIHKKIIEEKKVEAQSKLVPEPVVETAPVEDKEPMVQMTPLEFEMLIQRILNQVETNAVPSTTLKNQSQAYNENQILLLKKRVLELEKVANNAKLKNDINAKAEQSNDAKYQQVLNKLDTLNRKVESNTERIEGLHAIQKAESNVIEPEVELNETEEKVVDTLSFVEPMKLEEPKPNLSKLAFQDMAGFAGIMFGKESMPVIGTRAYFGIQASKIMLVPELFFGISNPISFGISGNCIMPININNATVKPYAGAGLGFMNIKGVAKLNANLILGANTNVLNGKLYVDFTIRNLFDYNQLAVGYKFNL
ncbi:hypothetical protein [Mariniflexile sp.]|uniref:hypothetical protein n=1 Tax=Mariniflexile sp. TaxID=1979402 RepID=UPI003563FE19